MKSFNPFISRETIGMKLLRKMGWKPGQGTGPRVTKMEKRKMIEEYKKTEVKVYGCTLPQDVGREKHYGSDSPCSTDDENDPELSFAPCDLQPFLCKPKDNCFGLGYSGLDRRSVLSSNLNLFTPTPLKMEEKKKKVLITGQVSGSFVIHTHISVSYVTFEVHVPLTMKTVVL